MRLRATSKRESAAAECAKDLNCSSSAADKTKRKDDSAVPNSTTNANRDNSVPILMHRSIDRLRSRPFKDREIVKEKSIFQKVIINKIEEQRGNRTFMETMAALGG